MGGGQYPSRLCRRCGRSLDLHVDGLECPRSLNGDRKAQQIRDKHVVDGDYSPKPRSGAYPRVPTKPLSVSMTPKEAASFSHHGNLPTLAPLFDMALEQLLKKMENSKALAQNHPAIVVQHPNIEENDADADDQDELDQPNIANAEENDHQDHPNVAINAQENDAEDASPTNQESTSTPTPTPTPSPSPSPSSQDP